jgi:hypothetical protein
MIKNLVAGLQALHTPAGVLPKKKRSCSDRKPKTKSQAAISSTSTAMTPSRSSLTCSVAC